MEKIAYFQDVKKLIPPSFITYLVSYGWNSIQIAYCDILAACKRNHIIIMRTPMELPGMYHVYQGQPYILLSDSLIGYEQILVGCHELSHHVLDSTYFCCFADIPQRVRIETRAHVTSSVSVIPQPFLKKFTPDDLLELFGIPLELSYFRLAVHEEFGY